VNGLTRRAARGEFQIPDFRFKMDWKSKNSNYKSLCILLKWHDVFGTAPRLNAVVAFVRHL